MYTLDTRGMKAFRVFNVLFLIFGALICLIPFVQMIALSFSSNAAIMAGRVTLFPADFTTEAYRYVIERAPFWRAFGVSLQRVLFGGLINMFLVVLLAYPLSKPGHKFSFRKTYVWFFFITMMFNGGLIPNYILINQLKMRNTLFALILPGAVNVYNIILMLNFFRQIPEEMEDAAYVDGASHWRTLWQIYLPVSLPALATIALFTIVGHWNSWFDGLIYMKVENYPLSSYLQTVVINLNLQKLSVTEMERLSKINDRSIRAAQVVVATIPILMVYPFLQKYFVSGLVLGSVKG